MTRNLFNRLKRKRNLECGDLSPLSQSATCRTSRHGCDKLHPGKAVTSHRTPNFAYHLHLCVFALIFIFTPLFSQEPIEKWAVYYSDSAPIKTFAPYQLLVFESESHPILVPFIENRVITLGYLNAGEIENHRDYFQIAKKQGLLLEENENWKGSWMIDLRNPFWSQYVVEELIPRILSQHFNGIFLDTLDNAEYLETFNPIKYKGMKKAAVDLVKAIRLNYPTIPIMVNRAYAILPEIADQIDMGLAESLYTSYDFTKKSYEKVPEQIYKDQVNQLHSIQKQHPQLKIFTLDYWNENDTTEIKKIYEMERKNGFIPYVSTISLDRVIPEP